MRHLYCGRNLLHRGSTRRRNRWRRCWCAWLLDDRGFLHRRRRRLSWSSKGWTNRRYRPDDPLCRSFWSRRGGCSSNSLWRRRGWSWRLGNGCRRYGYRRFRHRHGSRFSLPAQEVRHVAGLRDMREIDLGLELRLSRTRASLSARRSSALSGKMLADTLGLIDLDGARVRLLFRYSDFGKDIENSLAFDFQFPRQIVDSNFTHPPCALSEIPLDDHHNPQLSC